MNPPPTPAATSGVPAIEKVRSGQRFILFAILLTLLLQVVIFLVPRTGSTVKNLAGTYEMILLATVVLAVVGVVRLSSGLGYRKLSRLLIIISMFIPLLSLLILFLLNTRATATLRTAGYKVGLLGAAPKAA